MMRSFLALLTFLPALVMAQPTEVISTVYEWNDLKVVKDETRERRQVLEGSTTDLAKLEIHATTIQPGKAPHASHHHEDEELIIVKEGKLKVTIGDKTKVIGPGGIALAISGDEHGFVNGGETPATYYVLRYKSKLPTDVKRGNEAGGSFIIDRAEVPFTAHDKGGIRKYFDRPTSMFGRFEMHITTLNQNLKSHDPHTHRAEEIVLLMKGNGIMQISEEKLPVSPGGLIFLGANVLHAIQNNGADACEYFAFQWQ